MQLYFNDTDPEALEKAETLLFNGNGFLGVRGCLEEFRYQDFRSNRETYINGFYEMHDISYPESMHGMPREGETMIGVIDGQTSEILIGGEQLTMDSGKISEYSRFVEMSKGGTFRSFLWTSPKGIQTKVKISRCVSFIDQNLFATNIEFERLDHHEEIIVKTYLDARSHKATDKNDPRVSNHQMQVRIDEVDFDSDSCYFKTKRSALTGSLKWKFTGGTILSKKAESDCIIIESKVDDTTFTKLLSYSFREVDHAGLEKSFEEILSDQQKFMDVFWGRAKMSIESTYALEESVNYGIYAILQSAGNDRKTSIAAKGLSGSGYEGHYFWDTEMYIFPMLLKFAPERAKKLLEFRIETLPQAIKNRETIGYRRGALYPWRTISGKESSAFFEAGMAQHHINGDIAYAIIRYYEQTHDLNLLFDGGFEVLVETARLYAEIAYERDGEYHFDKVTGPDEYSVLVNDNFYTNKLIAYQMAWINGLSKQLEEADSERWQSLKQKMIFKDAELKEFVRIGKSIALPFDDEKEIIAQDRDFLNKAYWPLSEKETHHPLLLHYHPLMIYRYQICKQADAVLAMMLFEEDFSEEIIQRSVEYYDRITTHDSSLSYSIFSVIYARLNQTDKAFEYFLKNALIDLEDTHGNTKDGIHAASIAGTYLTIINGFSHLKFDGNHPSINGTLPKQIQRLAYKINYLDKVYLIEMDQNNSKVTEIIADEELNQGVVE
ncbi:hypothetical protein [Enterococcus gilvus]|uniref:glycoside hydrolase family 65 protein n=1 Tax=Enterococcus gilvus TaxID=160453 RepID=UPI00290EE64E|nr:hypothetical protein [Enterococcus gilvus]MDU5510733.1 hypothetical protein [Enterococcus gilvus]